MTLEELECSNCGAPLTLGLKCPYCGTSYIRENDYSSSGYITSSSTFSPTPVGLFAEDVARGLYRVIK